QRLCANKIEEVSIEFGGTDRVELGGRAVVEPTRVVLPDGSHVPRHLAVALTDVQCRGQGDISHQGVDVVAGVHSVDGAVMDIFKRVPKPSQLGVNAVGTSD